MDALSAGPPAAERHRQAQRHVRERRGAGRPQECHVGSGEARVGDARQERSEAMEIELLEPLAQMVDLSPEGEGGAGEA